MWSAPFLVGIRNVAFGVVQEAFCEKRILRKILEVNIEPVWILPPANLNNVTSISKSNTTTLKKTVL